MPAVYQGGTTALRLGEEWHLNRITMISTMAWWECPHRDHPLWNRPRINQVVTDLLAAGKLDTGGLISHRFPFDRAAEAMNGRPAPGRHCKGGAGVLTDHQRAAVSWRLQRGRPFRQYPQRRADERHLFSRQRGS